MDTGLSAAGIDTNVLPAERQFIDGANGDGADQVVDDHATDREFADQPDAHEPLVSWQSQEDGRAITLAATEVPILDTRR